jgi:hypothetical protein
MKFLSSLLMVLSFASHGMASSLPEQDGRAAEATMTNGQKTALHGVRQAKNLAVSLFAVALSLVKITGWELLTDIAGVSLLSGISFANAEGMLLQPISAKNMLLSALGIALPLAFLFAPEAPFASENAQTVILKGSSLMYLVGVALSCKDWYQGRHKTSADDASKPSPMTPQARALQAVRPLKHLASLVFSISEIVNHSNSIREISISFAMFLPSLEALLMQPMSAKRVILSTPVLAVPLVLLFTENMPCASKNIQIVLVAGSWAASCVGTMLSLKDWYQGRGTPETPAAKTA